MKRYTYHPSPNTHHLILALLLLAACTGDPAVDAVHRTADSLIAAGRADSALLLLQSQHPSPITQHPSPNTHHLSPSRRQLMRHELLRARAMNKAYVDFSAGGDRQSPDSVMLAVTDYYDSHGTPNERMEAHYLLGCVYRDMGEAPRAIDCYLDAAACADTTATDCDFHVLASIYAQMAWLYHQQLLLSYEIKAHHKACHYHFLAKDTLHALYEQKMTAGVFILLNKRDSAEAILLRTMSLYNQYKLYDEALLSSTMLMHLYMDQPSHIQDLGRLVRTFDEKSSFFDESHNLPPSQYIFYSYKAKYFEETNLLDSAEIYYRKMRDGDKSLALQESMYKGLLRISEKRHQADSMAKYARLYCAVNDSSLSVKDQEVTARMAASYQYNRIQKESSINAEKAHKANMRLFLVATVLASIILFTSFLIASYKKQRKEQLAKYALAVAERTRLKKEIESLKAKDYVTVIAKKEEEISALSQIIASHEVAYKSVISKDRLSVFEESSIVKTFKEKSSFKKDSPDLSSDEWDLLVNEFCLDMPSAYTLLKSLSQLQLHVCILLLLDFEEYAIALLKNTKPQTINNAKMRANKKLFQCGDSASLKMNLKGLVAT